MATVKQGTIRGPDDKRATADAIASHIFTTAAIEQIGNTDGYALIDNPNICGHVDVVVGGTATTLKLRPWVSCDGTTFAPAPDFGSPTVGSGIASSVASIAEEKYTFSTWDTGTVAGASASGTARLPFQFNLSGWSHYKLFAIVDSATGSPTLTGYVRPGMRG